MPAKLGGRFTWLVALLLMVTVGGCGDDDPAIGPAPSAPLASSPPMGWNTWNHFHCTIDEHLIRGAADAIVESGMRDAGYRFVNIDDCWQAPERDTDGTLRPNPERFPSGIKALADYVHARGLKLGLYGAPGSRTCANISNGYPGRAGSLGHEEQDARTFAAWGVDYLKYDWCAADQDGLEEIPAFTKMGTALRATGRPIVYSISEYGKQRPWLWGRSAGANLWRTTGDIMDLWDSVRFIVFRLAGIVSYSGPGGWNDPDMLEVGNGGMSDNEYRVHFGMWALTNAPLLVGNDPRSMSAATKEILLNRDVIAVDQDWGGMAGFKLRDDGDAEVWKKPMSDGSVTVALFNQGEQPAEMSVTPAELGLQPSTAYHARDLWTHVDSEIAVSLHATVPAHSLAMYRVAAR